MRILLLSPPIFDYYSTPARTEPLGLLHILDSLKNLGGVDVDLYDARRKGRKKAINRPDCFSYLDTFYQEDVSYFSLLSGYFRFGDSIGSIVQKIRDGKYDLVGVSALFSGYWPDVENIITAIKKHTGAMVVAGGWAVDAGKGLLFERSNADFFICGLGEAGMPALVEAIKGLREYDSVPGLIFRKNGMVITIPPVITPDCSMVLPRPNEYFFRGKRIASMILGRGCSNRCSFCSIPGFYGRYQRDLPSVNDELESLHESGVEIVNFEDDNFLFHGEFARKLLPLLKKFHARGLCYTAMNGITVSNAIPFLDDLIDAGFIEFNFSLVTGDNDLGARIGRPFAKEAVKNAIDKINGRVDTLVFCIIGLPGGSIYRSLDDIIWLAKMPVTAGISPLYLLPGVPALEKLGTVDDMRMMRGSALFRFGNGTMREDVASLWKYARMINRLKQTVIPFSREDEENIHYFKKSLVDHQWHLKRKNGRWEPGFDFSINLPDQLLFYSFFTKTIIAV